MKGNINLEIFGALKQKRFYFTQDGSNRFMDGQTVFFDDEAYVEPYSAVLQGVEIPTIGAFSYTYSNLTTSVKIGRYCSISWGVRVMAINHPMSFISTSSFSYDPHFIIFKQCLEDCKAAEMMRYGDPSQRHNRNNPPTIGNDVWIGQDVLLARGITLGSGCIVGAGSVVTKSVPPYAVVAGNPARVIRLRFNEELVSLLIASEWWKYSLADLAGRAFNEPTKLLEDLQVSKIRGDLRPFEPERISLKSIFASPEADSNLIR